MTYTLEQGMAVLTIAETLPVVSCVTRCYAVAMIFYRQPPGDRAWQIIRRRIGDEACDCLSYLTGFASGIAYSKKPLEVYAQMAGLPIE